MIEIEKVNFSYESQSQGCLSDLSLIIPTGQCLLLTGNSGCGKTTITRLINGLIPDFYEGRFSGSVRIDGKEIADWQKDDLAAKVGSVFQNPRSQFFNLDTTGEIAFGCENIGISREEIHKRVAQTAGELKIETLLDRDIFSLSGGEKQMISIASAYAMKPDIFVFDEPSANLDIEATSKLRDIIRLLKSQGKTIIIAEHRLYYLKGIVDRVLYLKDGSVLNDWTQTEFENLSPADLQKRGLRTYDLGTCALENKQTDDNRTVSLEISRLTVGYRHYQPTLADVSLKATSGEIVAIIGHNGQGKSTFAKCVCGLLKEKSGHILYQQLRLPYSKRYKFAYLVMQDSGYQLFAESVENELHVSLQKKDYDITKEQEILNLLGLDDKKERHPLGLSGGEKQRLAIAAGVLKGAPVIFFDEPTSGLDYHNMLRVCQILKELRRQGKIIFVITHDYEFLLAACDRVVEIENGKIVQDYSVSMHTMQKIKHFFKIGE